MNILLVGNYEPSGQKSMQRFAELLSRGFRAAGHETRVIRPPAMIGSLPIRGTTGKWLGYADKFLVFPMLLKKAVEWADSVHICDHANAFYVKYVRRPHVVTCHDMLAIRSALGEIACHRTLWTGRRLQSIILRGLEEAAHTGHIVCVSQATRMDILRIAKVPPGNISQIYNGLNFPYSPLELQQARKEIQRFGIRGHQRFILHVGGNSWYKNRLGVLKIFSSLKSCPEGKDLFLIMAGQQFTREMSQFLRDCPNACDVLELINPTNEELRSLYSCADLMLFPSIQEGFGWPIIEAQACGCPVVTSDRVPMTEIGGAAATYVNPDDIDATAAAIARKIRRRDVPCDESLKNAMRFSTSEMISRYLTVHETLVRSRQSNGHRWQGN